jgi:hypothetical protein
MNSRISHRISLNWISDLKKELFDKPFWEHYFVDSNVSTTLITTNSSFNKLPLAFLLNASKENKCKRIMFWYSANIKPLETNSLNITEGPKFVSLNSFIDEHLVWNLDQQKFLEAKGLQNVKAVGSIIFRPRVIENNLSKDFEITYFDVTPVEFPDTYYTYINCAHVLNDIIEARNILQISLEKPVDIYVKPKRNYAKFHSKKYVGLLAGLAKNGEINILPTTENLYRVISKSKYIVGIPFTSPVLIAQEMGIPCAFYAGGSHNLEIRTIENKIPVLMSVDDLTNEFRRFIT